MPVVEQWGNLGSWRSSSRLHKAVSKMQQQQQQQQRQQDLEAYNNMEDTTITTTRQDSGIHKIH